MSGVTATPSLYDMLERLGLLFRSEMRRNAADHGLALAQLEVLHYLARANRYSDTPQGVTEFVGTTKGTVSQTLRTLEDKGLLRKRPDASDGRLQHCTLTAKGKRVVERTDISRAVAELEPACSARLTADLSLLLGELQRRGGNKTFGICHSCRHFRREPEGYRCGLTQEPLSVGDSERICREHEPP